MNPLTLFLQTSLGVLVLLSSAHADLVAYYEFDDGSPLADSSGNGNDLQSAGADPSHEAAGGFSGGAYLFDGSQRLTAPIDINADSTGKLTMGAWVRTDALPYTVPGLHKVIGHNSEDDDLGFGARGLGLDDRQANGRDNQQKDYSYTANDLSFESGTISNAPAPENTADWTFLAVSYDEETSEATLYVDLDASTVGDTLTMVSSEEASGFIGAATTSIGSVGPDSSGLGWLGHIDNVFFFDEVLSAEQLRTFRDQGSAVTPAAEDPNLVISSFPNIHSLANPPANDLQIELTNNGVSNALTISGATVTGPDAAYFTVATPPESIAAGSTGNLTVTLDSQGQVGEFSAILEVASNDPSTPTTRIGLNARVTPTSPNDPALRVLNDPFLDLGSQRSPSTVIFTIENAGAAKPLNIVSIDVEGSTNFKVDEFPQTLGARQQGTITMTFDPQGAGGTFSGEMRIISDNGANRLTTVPLFANLPVDDASQFLIGFYSFDDADNPLNDDSGLGNTLTEGTAPVYEANGGFEGGAYQFDGSQNLIAPININPDEVPKLTMGAWVRTDSVPWGGNELHKVLGHDDGGWDRTIGLDDRVVCCDPVEDAYRFTAFTGSGPPAQGTPGPVSSTEWAFLAATYDQEEQIVTIFVDVDASSTDDDLVVVSESSVAGSGFPTVSIGSLRPDNTAEGWVGAIDNVFFYNTTLTSAQLTGIRNGGAELILTKAPKLIGLYSFDDPSSPLKDDSSSGNDLVEPDTPATFESGGGFEGGAFSFDGSQRLVAPININPSEIPQLTMGAWVRTDSTPWGGSELHKVMGHDDGGWDRTIGLDDRVVCCDPVEDAYRFTAFTGSGPPALGTPGPVNSTDWTFLAATYDQDEQKVTIYVDVDASTTEDDLAVVSESSVAGPGFPEVSIGSLRPDNNVEGWIGSIDNVFFYDGLLTSSQIRALRNGGVQAILNPSLSIGDDPDLRLPRGTAFGELGLNPGIVTRTVLVRNSGTEQTLNIASAELVGEAASHYSFSDFPETLAPGESAAVEVTFDPGERSGLFEAAISVSSDDSGNATLQLDLSARVLNPTGLAVHYAFDETDSEAMLDISGNGDHGVFRSENDGNVSVGANALASGTAIQVDDNNDSGAGFGEIPVEVGLPPLANFTVSMWANQSAEDTGTSALFSKGENAGDPFALVVNEGGLVFFSAGDQALDAADVITPGTTHHVVTTVNEAEGEQTAVIYVDGVEVASGVIEQFDDSAASSLQIGALNSAFGFTGTLDDFQLYSRALDASEVMQLFSNPGSALMPEPPMPTGPLPALTSVGRDANGLRLTLPDGEALDIEYSQDLIEWEIIANGASGPFEDADATRSGRPAGYYRARRP